jgi:hypothetical protein
MELTLDGGEMTISNSGSIWGASDPAIAQLIFDLAFNQARLRVWGCSPLHPQLLILMG